MTAPPLTREQAAIIGHTDARTTRIYLRGRKVTTVRPATRKAR